MKTRIKAKQPDQQADNYITQKGGSDAPALMNRYAYRITDNIKSAITDDIENDPVAKQYIPQNAELQILPIENTDPIGDNVHSPVKGIVHRYTDRVLFMPANICAVYCRYCFRREKVGNRGDQAPDILNENERTAALNYIKDHPEIWEVILTGGDPLVLSPRQLTQIIAALNTIDHVKIIRIHTRVPIAGPTRVTEDLIAAISQHTDQSAVRSKPIYMALHINHANELTSETRNAIDKLHKAGINLLSQSVLLKGVNNSADTLAELYRELITLNVKPYYIHHPDLAPGTSHFRLSIAEGQEIMNALRGRLSGICQPTYMLDIPGGFGKIPLTPANIQCNKDGSYKITDREGHIHHYADMEDAS